MGTHGVSYPPAPAAVIPCEAAYTEQAVCGLGGHEPQKRMLHWPLIKLSLSPASGEWDQWSIRFPGLSVLRQGIGIQR